MMNASGRVKRLAPASNPPTTAAPVDSSSCATTHSQTPPSTRVVLSSSVIGIRAYQDQATSVSRRSATTAPAIEGRSPREPHRQQRRREEAERGDRPDHPQPGVARDDARRRQQGRHQVEALRRHPVFVRIIEVEAHGGVAADDRRAHGLRHRLQGRPLEVQRPVVADHLPRHRVRAVVPPAEQGGEGGQRGDEGGSGPRDDDEVTHRPAIAAASGGRRCASTSSTTHAATRGPPEQPRFPDAGDGKGGGRNPTMASPASMARPRRSSRRSPAGRSGERVAAVPRRVVATDASTGRSTDPSTRPVSWAVLRGDAASQRRHAA